MTEYVFGFRDLNQEKQIEPCAMWIKTNVPMDTSCIDAAIDAARGKDE